MRTLLLPSALVWVFLAGCSIAQNGVELEYRENCGVNLKSIAQALQLYAHGQGGRFPDSFDALAESEPGLGITLFICPSTPEHNNLSHEQRLIDVIKSGRSQLSYIYSGKGLTTTSPSNAILAYETLLNHRTGANVVYVNGSVEFIDKRQVQHFIAELQLGHNPPRTVKEN